VDFETRACGKADIVKGTEWRSVFDVLYALNSTCLRCACCMPEKQEGEEGEKGYSENRQWANFFR